MLLSKFDMRSDEKKVQDFARLKEVLNDDPTVPQEPGWYLWAVTWYGGVGHDVVYWTGLNWVVDSFVPNYPKEWTDKKFSSPDVAKAFIIEHQPHNKNGFGMKIKANWHPVKTQYICRDDGKPVLEILDELDAAREARNI